MTVKELYPLLDLPNCSDIKTEVIVEVCGRTYDLKPEKSPEINDMVMAGVADFVVESIWAVGMYRYYITIKAIPVRKEAAE